MGQATRIPTKLPSVKRPRSAEVKRYGGGEKIVGERVEMATILWRVSILLVYLGWGCAYPPKTTPYMIDAIRIPGTRRRGKGRTKR